MKHKDFYMVQGVGKGAPHVKHESFEAAVAEAKRLAESCPGTQFIVLMAVAGFIASKPKVTFHEMKFSHDVISDNPHKAAQQFVDEMARKGFDAHVTIETPSVVRTVTDKNFQLRAEHKNSLFEGEIS